MGYVLSTVFILIEYSFLPDPITTCVTHNTFNKQTTSFRCLRWRHLFIRLFLLIKTVNNALSHIHTFLFRTRFFCHFTVCRCKTVLFVLSVGCSFLAKITGFIFGQIGFYRTQYTNTVHCCCCSQIMTKMSQNLAQILFVHKNSVTIFISRFHAWTKPLLCTVNLQRWKWWLMRVQCPH